MKDNLNNDISENNDEASNDNENKHLEEETEITPTKEENYKQENDEIVRKESNRKYILRNSLIALLIGFSAIGVLFVFLDSKDIISKLMNMPIWILLIGILGFSFVYLLDALRVKIVMIAIKQKISYIKLIRNSITGIFFNNITPFSMGGQPFRIYDLSRNGIDPIKATNGIISRHLSQMVVFLVISIIGYFIYSKQLIKLGVTGGLYLLGISVSITFTTLMLIFTVSDKVKKFFFKILHLKFIKKLLGIAKYNSDNITKKIDRKVREFKHSFNTLWKKNFLFMLIEAAISVALSMVLIGILYFYIRFFTEAHASYPSFLKLFLLFFVLNSVVYFSPTPGSTGVLEFTYVYIISELMHGTGSSSAIVAGVTAWRVATFYVPSLIGFITTFFYIKKPSKDKVKQENEGQNKKNINEKRTEKIGETIN